MIRELAVGETQLAYTAMLELRPAVGDVTAFVKRIDWMIDEAKRLGCGQFHLDSGTAADREDAHRLYFNKGMRISAFHFSRPV